jgi:hypothetical protein
MRRGRAKMSSPRPRADERLKRDSLQVASIAQWLSLVEHDVFGKPGSTFPNRALTAGWAA